MAVVPSSVCSVPQSVKVESTVSFAQPVQKPSILSSMTRVSLRRMHVESSLEHMKSVAIVKDSKRESERDRENVRPADYSGRLFVSMFVCLLIGRR